MSDSVVGTGGRSSDGGPEMIQLLTPEGKRTNGKNKLVGQELMDEVVAAAAEVSDEQLRQWFRDMSLVRRLDTEATHLQRHGELGLWVPCLGQEAAQIGTGHALRNQDFVFPGYREHGIGWVRGVDPIQWLRMFRGVTHGSWNPKEHNMQNYTVVIGTQMLHAAGYAMGVLRDGLVGSGDTSRDTAVLACTGDGGSAQGDTNEAFIFAGVANAPVVFLIQNNQWAISEPNTRQFRGPLYKRANGFGFPGYRVDGNDILASFALSRVLLDKARDGQGPALIEAWTYRRSAHTTTDDPTRYRLTAESEEWEKKDPIDRLRKYLDSKKALDQAFLDELEQEADDRAADLRERCKAVPDMLAKDMFDHAYSEPHGQIEREKAEFLAYHASLADSH